MHFWWQWDVKIKFTSIIQSLVTEQPHGWQVFFNCLVSIHGLEKVLHGKYQLQTLSNWVVMKPLHFPTLCSLAIIAPEVRGKMGFPVCWWSLITALCLAAYFNDIAVGAVCCRVDHSQNQKRLYIMTLGCLAPYRRLGIGKEVHIFRRWCSAHVILCFVFPTLLLSVSPGTKMLNHVLNICEKDGTFDNIYLWVCNCRRCMRRPQRFFVESTQNGSWQMFSVQINYTFFIKSDQNGVFFQT